MDIVISGRGIVSSLGSGVAPNWDAVRGGRSGIGCEHPLSQTLGRPVPLGHVAAFSDRDKLHDMADAAFTECAQSGELSTSALRDTALVFAQSGPDYDVIAREAQRIASSGQSRPDTVYRTMISYVGSKIGRRHKLRAPVVATSAACSGSGLSIHLGMAMIRAGMVDRCICGGAEIISRWMYSAFESMKSVLADDVLEGHRQRPYGADRRGVVLGEGAGFLMLERHDAARARGAPVYGRLLSSQHENVPEATWGDIPDASIWRDLLERTAGSTRPDLLLGHATSTTHGDAVEGEALQSLYPHVPTASLKPLFGHTLAASTVLDAVILMSCFEHQMVPGVGMSYALDPKLQALGLVETTRPHAVRSALKLTAGFGGSMNCLHFACA